MSKIKYNYLQNMNMNKSNLNVAAQLAQSAIQMVTKDISKGYVELPEQTSIQFSQLSKSRLSKQEEKIEDKFHAVIRKRKQLEQQLQRVKYDEQVIKQKRPHPMSQSQQGKTKYFRSSISQDEKQRINKIIKQTKKFEKAAAKKTLQLEQKIKKSIEQQKLLKQIIEKQKHEQKQKQIQQNLNLIQIRKNQRTKQIAQANKMFQKVAKRKFLHQQLQQKWKIIQKAEQQQNQKLFEKNRQQQKYKVEELKYHARRYSQIVKNNKQKRQMESLKIREELFQRSRLEKYSYSTFFKRATFQQNERKSLLTARIKQNQMLQTRRDEYAKAIKQRNKQSFNPQKSSPIPKQKKKDIRISMSLDNLALNKLGNQYMKKINAKVGEQQEKKPKQTKTKQRDEQTFKYPDYLTKARLSRQSLLESEPQRQEIKQLKHIMKNKQEDKMTKLKRAKLFVTKLDERAGESSDNIIGAIMAKLSIIDEFAVPQ